MMKIKNIYLALKDQGPFLRFIRNFLITRNAWGLFHINSHIAQGSGKPKVIYNTRITAEKSALAMMKKYDGTRFNVYKCIMCDGYHIGKNKSK